MLAIKSRGPAIISTRAPPQFKNFSALINDSQWEVGRLGYAAELIVKILKEDRAHAGNEDGLSLNELETAAKKIIDDNALLTYLFRNMNNMIVGNHVVCCLSESNNELPEYTLMEYGKGTIELESEISADPLPVQAIVPGADVYKDVAYLYINVLLNYPASEAFEAATKIALESKQFVKEYVVKEYVALNNDGKIINIRCNIL